MTPLQDCLVKFHIMTSAGVSWGTRRRHSGLRPAARSSMKYHSTVEELNEVIGRGASWTGIDPEAAARMRLQNRFGCGLDIARHTAAIMRADMAVFDADPSAYT